jgi:hypothetical protein
MTLNESYKGFSLVATFCDEIVVNHPLGLRSEAGIFLIVLIPRVSQSSIANAERDGRIRRSDLMEKKCWLVIA